ncbi:hypothetical protein GF385_00595 [Candidatus Dependentiae bacterium]|nr:hypothetical protein [Candidatus Dependentiae bacterium]
MNNFFRKDLNLKKRWWHRLFVVLFFASFILALYTIYDTFNSPIIPQYEIVDSVNDRITTDVKQIQELKKPNEIVEELHDRPGASYHLNVPTDKTLYDDIFCSNDLENKVADVQNKTGIRTLFIRDMYGRNDVPIETFTNYIRKNSIKCLLPDAYTHYDINGQEDGKLKFLEPIGQDSLYYKDLVFYKKSNLLTTLYILKISLLVIAGFVAVVILYYKVFLYIIFGNKK